MCSAPRPFVASCDPRQVLPSIATRRPGLSASVAIASAIQAWKQRWKASGFSATSRRRMQSREGMPLGKARCNASHDSRCLAQRWMAVGPSHPQRMPQTAMTAMSPSRCLRDSASAAGRRVTRSTIRSREPTSTSPLAIGGTSSVRSVPVAAPNRDRRPKHDDRIKDIERRPVAPDYPDCAAMRAGRGSAAEHHSRTGRSPAPSCPLVATLSRRTSPDDYLTAVCSF